MGQAKTIINPNDGKPAPYDIVVHLFNVIMGCKFYCSRTHFLLNYCVGADKKLADVEANSNQLDLNSCFGMIYDRDGNRYKLKQIKAGSTLHIKGDWIDDIVKNTTTEGEMIVLHAFK